MPVELRQAGFDPWREMQNYQANAPSLVGKYGATSVFVGTMRDFNEGDDIRDMLLEHYPGMTEKSLESIVEKARQRWNFLDTLVVHRVGEVRPNDPIVLVAVWSAHRGAAFDACRQIMEELKSRAPFWKRETLAEKSRWVGKNTDGY